MKNPGSILLTLGCVFAICLVFIGMASPQPPLPTQVEESPLRSKTDQEIRNSVVRLRGPMGMCSGEQIMAPSGKQYIITAKHCSKVAMGDWVLVETEQHKLLPRRILAVDPAPTSDLMLVDAVPGLPALKVSDQETHRFEHIRTFTHGSDMDTYMTEGNIVQDMLAHVGAGDEMMNLLETVTTARIQPGSSGGAFVDDKGDLIVVASASGEYFSLMVRLIDIKAFLADK